MMHHHEGKCGGSGGGDR